MSSVMKSDPLTETLDPQERQQSHVGSRLGDKHLQVPKSFPKLEEEASSLDGPRGEGAGRL